MNKERETNTIVSNVHNHVDDQIVGTEGSRKTVIDPDQTTSV